MSFGRPCIVTNRGVLADHAARGGCLALENTDPQNLAKAMRRLLSDRDLYERLSDEASRYPMRTWSRYAEELVAWLESLEKRPPQVLVD